MDKKIRVLYAEDNPQDADLTQNHFQQEAPEFELEIVGAGKECLERLKAKEYDALLLDYRLPDMDGTDVLKTMMLQGFTLPVVMVTGAGDEELVVKALRLGASDYVPKRPNYLIALPGILRNIADEYRRKKKAGRPLAPSLKHILYVEHTQMDIELTVRHFAETAPHIQVEPVQSGREALQLLTQTPDGRKPCDLMMADLCGSDISGLELCREVKHRGMQLPMIIITGKGDEEAAVAALQLGAYDYIVKHENYLTKLPYTVENAIARFQLEQEIIVRKQAEEKILKLNRVYAVISQINQAIVRVREKDKILSEACRIAVEYGKFRMAWIGMIDEDAHLVKPVAYSGVDDGYLSRIKKISTRDVPAGRGPTGTAVRESRHYVCADIEKDPHMEVWREEALKRGYHSSMALPIRQFDKVIGAFSLYASVPHFFDQEEIHLLDEVTNDISFAIDAIETAKKKMEAEEELKKHREHLEEMVKDRTAELEKKIAEIERLNRLFVGRELRMKELKEKIAKLEKEGGKVS